MQALKFADIQALGAALPAPLPCINGAAERAALVARGAIRTRSEPRHDFVIGVALDDAGVRDAAIEILQREIRGSVQRLERVLGQADPRIAEALRALVKVSGLPREAA
jgi:hypothetical protein